MLNIRLLATATVGALLIAGIPAITAPAAHASTQPVAPTNVTSTVDPLLGIFVSFKAAPGNDGYEIRVRPTDTAKEYTVFTMHGFRNNDQTGYVSWTALRNIEASHKSNYQIRVYTRKPGGGVVPFPGISTISLPKKAGGNGLAIANITTSMFPGMRGYVAKKCGDSNADRYMAAIKGAAYGTALTKLWKAITVEEVFKEAFTGGGEDWVALATIMTADLKPLITWYNPMDPCSWSATGKR